jgi:tRNA 2-selenouridine synthase
MTPLTPQETLRLLKSGRLAFIDVRSEGEFEEGHIPGFINMPILSNQERHEVGLTYKNSGQEKAIQVGHELVAPFRENRIHDWTQAALASSEKTAVVTCWRGGLRSKIAQQWLEAAGVRVLRVQGGYKALRRELLKTLDVPAPFVILTGLTGTGKTKLLTEVPVPKLDLESLAHHRGSSFGQDLFQKQPSQTTFENQLALALEDRRVRLVEDESRRIGRVILPNAIKEQMKVSPVVVLESPIHARVELIFEGYIREPIMRGKSKDVVREHLLTQLDLIHKQLGGALHSELRAQLLVAFQRDTTLEAHSDWIRGLLLRHYDPRYRYAFNRQDRKILFQGEYWACHQFLTLWFSQSLEHSQQPEMVGAY